MLALLFLSLSLTSIIADGHGTRKILALIFYEIKNHIQGFIHYLVLLLTMKARVLHNGGDIFEMKDNFSIWCLSIISVWLLFIQVLQVMETIITGGTGI